MKKTLKIFILLSIVIIASACTSNSTKFKESYESLNGKTNANGKEYRTIEIDKNNPFVYTSLEKINKKIKKQETFIVYFGANWCPWCRSVLPTAIEEAHNYNINKIYYIDVREDNEIEKDIRDIYEYDDNGNIYLSHEGTKAYRKFLKYADSVLNEYSSHGVTVETAKRVGAPSFILVKNGVVTKLETGVSEKETDPYMELNEEIINEMHNKFKTLYEEYLK